jgi:hypothetical protein
MLQDPQTRALLLSLSCVKIRKRKIMGMGLAGTSFKYLWVLGGKYRKAFSTARRHSAALFHHHLFHYFRKRKDDFQNCLSPIKNAKVP